MSVQQRTRVGLRSFGGAAGGGFMFLSPAVDFDLSNLPSNLQILASAPVTATLPDRSEGKGFTIASFGATVTLRASAFDGGGVIAEVPGGWFVQVFPTEGVGVSPYGAYEPASQVAGVSAVTVNPANGPLQLDSTSEPVQIITPQGSPAVVILPPASSALGRSWLIRNAGSEENFVHIQNHADDGGAVISTRSPGDWQLLLSAGLQGGAPPWITLRATADKGIIHQVDLPSGTVEVIGARFLQEVNSTGPNGAGDIRFTMDDFHRGRVVGVKFTSLGGAAGTEGAEVTEEDGSPIGGGVALPDVAGVPTTSTIFLVFDGDVSHSFGAFAPVVGSF